MNTIVGQDPELFKKILERANFEVKELLSDYLKATVVDAQALFMAIYTSFQVMEQQSIFITKFHIKFYPQYDLIIDAAIDKPDRWSYKDLMTLLLNIYIPLEKTNNMLSEIILEKGKDITLKIREYPTSRYLPYNLEAPPQGHVDPDVQITT